MQLTKNSLFYFILFYNTLFATSSFDLKTIYGKAIIKSILYQENITNLELASNKKLIDASKFYPKLSAYYEYLQINEFPVTEDNVITGYRKNRQDKNLRVDQVLFDRNIFTEFSKSSDNKRFKILELKDSKSKLMLELIEKYFSMLAVKDELELLNKELESYKHILDKAKLKEQSGLISKVDLLEAISEKNLVLARIVETRASIQTKALELENIAGLDIDDIVSMRKDLNTNLLENELNYFTARLNENIEIKKNIFEIKDKHKEMINHNMLYIPKVSAYYEYTDYDTPGKESNQKVGLKFELNI